MEDDQEVYEAVGGDAPFFELVEEFYRGVERDPAIRALYPEDLAPGKKHLAWFLIQRFGGPDYFNQRRGHPRLRIRHAPFAITLSLRDAWVHHMTSAVDAVPPLSPYRELLLKYFADAATFLINRAETQPGGIELKQV